MKNTRIVSVPSWPTDMLWSELRDHTSNGQDLNEAICAELVARKVTARDIADFYPEYSFAPAPEVPPTQSNTQTPTIKKIGLTSKIESREDAEAMVKSASSGFLVVAAIQGGIGAFIMPTLIIDALIYAGLSLVLRKWRSRVAAILLLLISFASLTTTILTKIGIQGYGGGNIVLAVIVA